MFTPTSWYSSPAPYHSSNRGATWDVHLINYATFSRDAWDRCSSPGKGAGVHPDLVELQSGPISLEQPGGGLGTGDGAGIFFPRPDGSLPYSRAGPGMLEVGVPAAEALKYTTAWHAKPVWIGQLDRGELDVNEASYCLPDELENGRAKTLLTTETLAAFRNFKMDGPLVM